MLIDTADYGGGQALTADNADELQLALDQVVSTIRTLTGSSASITATTTFLSSDGVIFQAGFNSARWNGKLLAFKIKTENENHGEVEDIPTWDAADLIPQHDDRKIITAVMQTGDANSFTPVVFAWNNLSAKQKRLLDDNPQILKYLRGAQELEQQQNGTFRDRTSALGDIVHSTPAYLAATPSLDYPDPDYQTFKNSFDPEHGGSNRNESLYVGANDGMLHGFNARTGTENFAYVPYTAYQHLASLSDPDYNHHYFIDGSPVLVNAKIAQGNPEKKWQTVLATSMGAGGKALFALNVTDPSTDIATQFNRDRWFLWEINNQFPLVQGSDKPMYPDLGYVLTRPSIVRVKTKDGSQKWFTVFGNGVLSDSGNAVLYLIGLDDGRLDHQIVVDNDGDNGMTSVAVIDLDYDTYADRIYAPDLKGNIWRFDWNQEKDLFESRYLVNNQPAPLFHATTLNNSGAYIDQPITTELEFALRPATASADEVMVFFGTGRYFEYQDNPKTGDTSSLPLESFYGIWDSNSATGFNLGNDDLLQQTIASSNSRIGATAVRVSSELALDWRLQRGWFINLPDRGERVIFSPMLVRDKVLFVTYIPNADNNNDPCITPSSGWLMELQALSGAGPNTTIIDVNSDGKYDAGDDSGGRHVSGVQSTTGAPLPPSIIRQHNESTGMSSIGKYSSTTSGKILHVRNEAKVRRKSWRLK